MCGLFGVYLKSPTDKKALTSALYESIEDIAHRGPDEKALTSNQTAGLVLLMFGFLLSTS